MSAPTLQQRVVEWHGKAFPAVGSYQQLAKLTEEVGELARAHIAGDEGRPNRGDVAQEAAQVVIVLLAFIGRRYPDVDLMRQVLVELRRLEGKL